MLGSTRLGPLILVATLLTFGVVYLATTLAADRPTDTKIFPLFLAVVFLGLLVWEGVATLLKHGRGAAGTTAVGSDEAPSPVAETAPETGAVAQESVSGGRSPAATFFGLVVLTALFAYLGTQVDYVLATGVFMVSAMCLIGSARRSWPTIAVVAVVSVVAVKLIFVQVLSVRLPSVIPGL